eukprot:GHVS01095288.1.p1 GENE.GHVS01095288.1~~GHVS01095288.1.p1  ORF type:complete len:1924 (-),score=140.03 GHVS01095288.1:113-5884(-)
MITSLGRPKLVRTGRGSPGEQEEVVTLVTSPCSQYLAAVTPRSVLLFSNGRHRYLVGSVRRGSDTAAFGDHVEASWSRSSRRLLVATKSGKYVCIYSMVDSATGSSEAEAKRSDWSGAEATRAQTENDVVDTEVGSSSDDESGPHGGVAVRSMLTELSKSRAKSIVFETVLSLPLSCSRILCSSKRVMLACSEQPALLFMSADELKYVADVVYLDRFLLQDPHLRRTPSRIVDSSLRVEGSGGILSGIESRRRTAPGIDGKAASSTNPGLVGSLLYCPFGSHCVEQHAHRMRRYSDVGDQEGVPDDGASDKHTKSGDDGQRLGTDLRRNKIETGRRELGSFVGRCGIRHVCLNEPLDLLGIVLNNGAALVVAWQHSFKGRHDGETWRRGRTLEHRKHKEAGDKEAVEGAHSGNEGGVMGVLVCPSGACRLEFNRSRGVIAVGNADGSIDILSALPLTSSRCKSPLYRINVAESLGLGGFRLRQFGSVEALQWTRDGLSLLVGWSDLGLAAFSYAGRLLFAPFRSSDIAPGAFSFSHGCSRTGSTPASYPPFSSPPPSSFAIGKRDSGVDAASRSGCNGGGVLAACWCSKDLSLLVSYKGGMAGTITDYAIYRSASIGVYPSLLDSAGSRAASDTSTRILIGADRLLVAEGSPWSPFTVSWNHIPLPPPAYTDANWPLRQAALSPNGEHLLATGVRGLALYSQRQGRWRLFGNVQHEMALQTGNLPIGWYTNSLLYVCVRRFSSWTQMGDFGLSEAHREEARLDEACSSGRTIGMNAKEAQKLREATEGRGFTLVLIDCVHRLDLDLAVAVLPELPARPLRTMVLRSSELLRPVMATHTITSDDMVSNPPPSPPSFQAPLSAALSHLLGDETVHFDRAPPSRTSSNGTTLSRDASIDGAERGCWPVLGVYDADRRITAYQLELTDKLNIGVGSASSRGTIGGVRTHQVVGLWQCDLSGLGWIDHPLEIRWGGHEKHLLVLHANGELTALDLHDVSVARKLPESKTGGLPSVIPMETGLLVSGVFSVWTGPTSQLSEFCPLPAPAAPCASRRVHTSSVMSPPNGPSALLPDCVGSPPLNKATDRLQWSGNSADYVDQGGERRGGRDSSGAVAERGLSVQLRNLLKQQTTLNEDGEAAKMGLGAQRVARHLLDDAGDLEGGMYVWCQVGEGLVLLTVSIRRDDGKDQVRSDVVPVKGEPGTASTVKTRKRHLFSYRQTLLLPIEQKPNPVLIVAILAESGVVVGGSLLSLSDISRPAIATAQLRLQCQPCFHSFIRNLLEVSYFISAAPRESLADDSHTSVNSDYCSPAYAFALALCRRFEPSPFFKQCLELVLHEVLEEVIPVYSSKHKLLTNMSHAIPTVHLHSPFRPSLIPSVTPGQVLQTCCREAPTFRTLSFCLDLLKCFEHSLAEVLIAGIRKTEPLTTPILVFPLGALHPHRLFFSCLANGLLRTASLYLLVLQNIVGPLRVRSQYVLLLIRFSLAHNASSLTKNLVNFFKALYVPTPSVYVPPPPPHHLSPMFTSYPQLQAEPPSRMESQASLRSVADRIPHRPKIRCTSPTPSPLLKQSSGESPFPRSSVNTQIYILPDACSPSLLERHFFSPVASVISAAAANGHCGGLRTSGRGRSATCSTGTRLWSPSCLGPTGDQAAPPVVAADSDGVDCHTAAKTYAELERLVSQVLVECVTRMQWLRLYYIASVLKLDLPKWLEPLKPSLSSLNILIQEDSSVNESGSNNCGARPFCDLLASINLQLQFTKSTSSTASGNTTEPSSSTKKCEEVLSYLELLSTSTSFASTQPRIANAFSRRQSRESDEGDTPSGTSALCKGHALLSIKRRCLLIQMFFLRVFLLLELSVPAFCFAVSANADSVVEALLATQPELRQRLKELLQLFVAQNSSKDRKAGHAADWIQYEDAMRQMLCMVSQFHR